MTMEQPQPTPVEDVEPEGEVDPDPEPDLEDEGGEADGDVPDADDVVEEIENASAAEEDEDIDLADVDVGEPVGDPFDGVDAGPSGPDPRGEASNTGTQDADSESADPFGDLEPDRLESLEEDIVEGAARLAVVGMDDGDEKDKLNKEFEEVFEAARLGYYGSEFMQEYIFVDEQDDIDPLWGMVASLTLCSFIVLWRRPDGDELVGSAKEQLGDIGIGA